MRDSLTNRHYFSRLYRGEMITGDPGVLLWPTNKDRNKHLNILTGLRIPTGRKQTSWLFTSMTERLNLGLQRKNPATVWHEIFKGSNFCYFSGDPQK